MLNGSIGGRRRAASVSLICSQKKEDCNISDPANKNASHKRPGPKRRDSDEVGLNVKLNRTITINTKTTVVPSNSRERNSVRNSLARITPVAGARVMLRLLPRCRGQA